MGYLRVSQLFRRSGCASISDPRSAVTSPFMGDNTPGSSLTGANDHARRPDQTTPFILLDSGATYKLTGRHYS